jgi:hypothetical protein
MVLLLVLHVQLSLLQDAVDGAAAGAGSEEQVPL